MSGIKAHSTSCPAMEDVPCPLCGSASFRPWLTGRDWLYGGAGEFQIVRCSHCRHVYVNPRPREDSLPQYYPETYGPHSQTARTEAAGDNGSRWKKSLRRWVGLRRFVHWLVASQAEWIPPRRGSGRALEVGCGDGAFLERLQATGWQAEGLEFSATAVERARAHGLEVRLGTLEEISLPPGSYDAVFLWMVLEHLPDPVQALTILRQAVTPDGWLVFSVPNVGCWEPYLFGRFWHAWDLPRHLQHFSPRSVRQLLAATGFRTERMIHQRSLINVAGSAGLWLRHRRPGWSWGQRLLDFTENPTAPGLLLLAPAARLLAWLRQAGRLTVVARPADISAR